MLSEICPCIKVKRVAYNVSDANYTNISNE